MPCCYFNFEKWYELREETKKRATAPKIYQTMKKELGVQEGELEKKTESTEQT